jgi:hypothetical protein
MKIKRIIRINQSYMDLIEDGWRIHGICKKKETDKTIAERNPDTKWYFAIWPVKKYVVAWYKV